MDALGAVSFFELPADKRRQAAFIESDNHVVMLLAAQQRDELEASIDRHAHRHRKDDRFQRLAIAVLGEGD